MGISWQTVSGMGGSLRQGCETWTGSFYLLVLTWTLMGSGRWSVRPFHGAFCGGHWEELCAYWDYHYSYYHYRVQCHVYMITEIQEDRNEPTCYFHGFCFFCVGCRIESWRGNKKTKLLSYCTVWVNYFISLQHGLPTYKQYMASSLLHKLFPAETATLGHRPKFLCTNLQTSCPLTSCAWPTQLQETTFMAHVTSRS